ncbi:acyltransferase family protein [Nocardioides sp. zg-579]|uniref:Acyltransferase family protein n=1 Tax=Nocardioides marmotae TaxID=2663857 RepID=A0A6I3JC55_9ACTN|nr:acyltransferase [Nocardioides marmotae]MCR6032028.1 acyltransferase family protein [Gordonia jinghuaiqii]MTB95671.1 acyltransferase family protein [Nocardioides marmotae]QKE01079.1 acyltransferase [Nocardioides marmotae]
MTTVAAAPVELDVSDPPHFPALDALRAVGALAVLVTHVAFWSGDYGRHGYAGTLLSRLDVGVAIFFVLSGFLLSRPYLARAAQTLPPPSTRSYLWRRFLRITPVYVVAALLALALLDDNADLGAPTWATTLLLGNTFVDPLPPAGLTHMWSLAVEVCFYLLLPLLMLAATGRRGRGLSTARVVTVLVAMTAVTAWWHLHGADWADTWTGGAPGQWLPGYLSWFAAGIGLALVHVLATRGSATARRLLAPGRQAGACWTLAGALLLVAATPLAGPTVLVAPTTAESLTKNLLYTAIGVLLVLPALVADERSGFGRAFGHPLARRLGVVSYSLFAFHLLVLHAVMAVTGWQVFSANGPLLLLASLAGSLVLAEVGYRVLEVPAMRLKRLVPPRRAEPIVATTATSGTTER